MGQNLSGLIHDVEILTHVGPDNCEVLGLSYDSRTTRKGDVFFALPGVHSDGHLYVSKAISEGAVVVVHERSLQEYFPGIVYIRVANCRAAMSTISSAFYDDPSRSLFVIGVTGTEGKSTTVYLTSQLLNLSGERTGFFSTVMSDTGSGEVSNPEHQTTPESTSVQRMLAEMRDSGMRFAVIEASSHGLSFRTARLADVLFDIAIMTNVAREHLEFHGTWEQYRSDKANLFRSLDLHRHIKTHNGIEEAVPSAGILNLSDPSAEYFTHSTCHPTFSFSSNNPEADLSVSHVRTDSQGSDFVIAGSRSLFGSTGVSGNAASSSRAQTRIRKEARINLPGEFNIANTLAAILTASIATGKSWTSFLPYLPLLKPVRGRMMRVDAGQPFEVIIDYAHTPSSFEAILPSIRSRVRGKLLCVFGSAGERDTEKRPEQGRIAAKYCDMLVLSDEDPRGEDSVELLEQIAAGCADLPRGERLFLVPDRYEAIRTAFSLAKSGDIVLLLGKGHENSIIYKDHTIPYDEEKAALSALEQMGYVVNPRNRL
jgi:UDP-N-acetylmuramoyl-L-alanyl-D-glutamate--2,6-diaminopimelate ligase